MYTECHLYTRSRGVPIFSFDRFPTFKLAYFKKHPLVDRELLVLLLDGCLFLELQVTPFGFQIGVSRVCGANKSPFRYLSCYDGRFGDYPTLSIVDKLKTHYQRTPCRACCQAGGPSIIESLELVVM